MADQLPASRFVESLFTFSASEENVRPDLHPLRLSKPSINKPACFAEKLRGKPGVPSEQFQGSRQLFIVVISMKPVVDPAPLTTQLVQQERSLCDCAANITKLVDLFPKFGHLWGRYQHRPTSGFRICHVQDPSKIISLNSFAESGYLLGPLINWKVQSNGDPHGSPLGLFATTTVLDTCQAKGNSNCQNGTDRRPSIPPDHTSTFARRPARANGVPPAHSLPRLMTGRHFAMSLACEELIHG